ncbi:MAG: TIGR00725 family protein [Acidobacteria bacterium]|nr:MAG: TIGR00725 family protein [Acidobacteriota bacterium]
MGPGEGASETDRHLAYEFGRAIAREGWTTLCGGRNSGVMEAASRGAKEAGGSTIGVLPGSDDRDASPFLDLAIVTGMGNARNSINVLSSHVVVACGMGKGTASEVALALKARKPVVLLNSPQTAIEFFRGLDGQRVLTAASVEEAIEHCRALVKGRKRI